MEFDVRHTEPSLIINPIEHPLASARVTLANRPVLQLQVHLGGAPLFSAPQFPEREVGPFFRVDSPLKFRAQKMTRPFFWERYRGRGGRTEPPQSRSTQWQQLSF